MRRLAGIEQEPATIATQPKQGSSKRQSIKLRLAKTIQKLPCAQSRGKSAIKREPWGGINIPGQSTAELKQHLHEMLGMTWRLLIARVHPDCPTRPIKWLKNPQENSNFKTSDELPPATEKQRLSMDEASTSYGKLADSRKFESDDDSDDD